MQRLIFVALAALVVSCESPVAVPDGAVRFAPDRQQYIVWWREVEACSGLRGDFDRVSFYEVPGYSSVLWGDTQVTGLWLEAGNRIVLAGTHVASAGVVRHEMLHALLKLPGHPPEYFQGLCAPLMD